MKKEINLQPKTTVERRQKLRNNMTEPEIILWQHLKKRGLGHKFSRQYGVGGYILDFYCPLKKIAVELDGSQHAEEENKAYDKVRTEYLEDSGIKVIRFWNNEVFSNMNGVLEKILSELKKREDSF